ncbi:MAG: 1-acyl-sn-glycerol-3-phosphate acyltransferase, partial [Pseudomonadota bacterium]
IDLYFAATNPFPEPVASVSEFVTRDGSLRVLIDLALLGAFGGFYSVPLYALVQRRANRQQLSRIIAANNIINAIFMVFASVLAIVVLSIGFTIPQLFIILSILNLAVAVYIFTLLPEFLLRFLAWIATSLLYRIRVHGEEHIPDEGPAVLVCNHVSFVDALVLGGAVRRPLRFVMYYKIFEIPLLRLLFKTAKAIPIASAREDEALMEACFDEIAERLEEGEIVCLFPEGAITRDGEIHGFRPGVERIIERTPVPVVPVALSGLWGSWFSRQSGGGLRKIPGKLFARVDVRIAPPVPPDRTVAAKL